MANYYYVIDTGTAGTATDDGRFTTKQTGAFTNATSYADIKDALAAATAPVGGDIIVCADTHNTTYTTNTSISSLINDTGAPLYVVSADVNNRDTYKAGASEIGQATPKRDLNYYDSWAFYGVTLTQGDGVVLNDGTDVGGIHMRNCTLLKTGTDLITVGNKAARGRNSMHNLTLGIANTSTNGTQALVVANFLECHNVSIDTNGSTYWTNEVFHLYSGAHLIVRGIDLDATAFTSVVEKNAAFESRGYAVFSGMHLDTGLSTDEGSLDNEGDVWFQFDAASEDVIDEGHLAQGHGDIFEQPDTTRSGGASSAWKMITDAATSEPFPLTTQWINGWFDDATAKTVDMYIGTDDADYNDNEVWLELEYFAGTTPLTTVDSGIRDNPLDTAVASGTDDTGSSWTGGLTYMRKLTASVTPGYSGGSPFRVRLCFGKPSVTANPLFVDPLIVVA